MAATVISKAEVNLAANVMSASWDKAKAEKRKVQEMVRKLVPGATLDAVVEGAVDTLDELMLPVARVMVVGG